MQKTEIIGTMAFAGWIVIKRLDELDLRAIRDEGRRQANCTGGWNASWEAERRLHGSRNARDGGDTAQRRMKEKQSWQRVTWIRRGKRGEEAYLRCVIVHRVRAANPERA